MNLQKIREGEIAPDYVLNIFKERSEAPQMYAITPMDSRFDEDFEREAFQAVANTLHLGCCSVILQRGQDLRLSPANEYYVQVGYR